MCLALRDFLRRGVAGARRWSERTAVLVDNSAEWRYDVYIMEIILTIGIVAGLSLLIIIHEAGHFIVGKLLGFYIKEFGIGYPPRIFGKK